MIRIDYHNRKEKGIAQLKKLYISQFATKERKKAFKGIKFRKILFNFKSLKRILSLEYDELLNEKIKIEQNFWNCKDEEFLKNIKSIIENKQEGSKRKIELKKQILDKISQAKINQLNINNLKDYGFSEKEQQLILNIGFKSLWEIFNYTGLQPEISKFFEKYINPKTCYYCNIDFINVFGEFIDVYDFIKNAPIEQFKNISNFENYKEEILKIQNDRNNQINEEEIKNNLNGFFEKIEKHFQESFKTSNGFTLDHVIDKGTHPYFALSLFNLVPSCYTCNSKLKRSENIGENISPSADKKFDFHQKVKFKTYLSTNNDTLQIEKIEDIEIFLKEYDTNQKYKKYIEVFRLDERYRYHRNRVIEMIDKRKRYPDSRIRELATQTNQTFAQVKKDLFGDYWIKEEDFHKRPLSKLTHDIAEELGLI